ncbi:MAG: transcriptional repressor, partial [Acidimicrobiia bacterium]
MLAALERLGGHRTANEIVRELLRAGEAISRASV